MIYFERIVIKQFRNIRKMIYGFIYRDPDVCIDGIMRIDPGDIPKIP